MKKVFFIYPKPKKTNPRGIRIHNIVKYLQKIAPENDCSILTFNNKLNIKKEAEVKLNKLNFIYLLFKYFGGFRFGGRISKLSQVLDPLIFIHPLIKFDINKRLKSIDKNGKVVFVVVVSPFSNYLLVSWLRKKYPNSNIICDLGDPLYKNSARWNDDEVSRKIEFKALQSLNKLIVTNELTKEHFINEFKVKSSLVHVIPQGVNTELIESVSKKSVEKKSMAYAGKFYSNLRPPDALFEALSNQNKYTLDVYGNNPEKDLNNVFFHNSLEQTELFKTLSRYEVLVFIDNKSGIQTSGKIFELLAFKKIILFIKGDEESPTYKMVNKFQNVIFCENNKDSILKAISKIRTFNSLKFDYDINCFSWGKRAETYLKLIE